MTGFLKLCRWGCSKAVFLFLIAATTTFSALNNYARDLDAPIIKELFNSVFLSNKRIRRLSGFAEQASLRLVFPIEKKWNH